VEGFLFTFAAVLCFMLLIFWPPESSPFFGGFFAPEEKNALFFEKNQIFHCYSKK
jgi:hypothetical protein